MGSIFFRFPCFCFVSFTTNACFVNNAVRNAEPRVGEVFQFTRVFVFVWEVAAVVSSALAAKLFVSERVYGSQISYFAYVFFRCINTNTKTIRCVVYVPDLHAYD